MIVSQKKTIGNASKQTDDGTEGIFVWRNYRNSKRQYHSYYKCFLRPIQLGYSLVRKAQMSFDQIMRC
jgi:hypothetical protein